VLDLPATISIRFASRAAGAPPALASLSAEERARLAAFGSIRRQRGFALGRATARALLAERLAVPPDAVEIAVAEDGAPEVVGHPLALSLAHTETASQSLALAAVASGAVGVDLEAIRPRNAALHRRIMQPDEFGLLDQLGDRDRAVITVWAIKEAVLKAERTGLRVAARDVRLALDAGRQRGTAVAPDGRRWEVRFAEAAGCIAAVAFRP
jgi:4'-phosphopantetheinyl transferase